MTPKTNCRPGFTLPEIMIVVVLVSLVVGFVWQTFDFASKAERATNKKLLAARALQYVQSRIRRDVKWARKVSINGESADSGTTLELSDLDGTTRRYSWNPATRILRIPELTNPTTQIEYNQARFRRVVFYQTKADAEGVRAILSPIPFDEREKTTEQEQLWGAAMVGQAEVDAVSTKNRYRLFNEPAFPNH